VLLVQELSDLLNTETLILRYMDRPDLGGAQPLLLVAHELAKEVDRYVVVWGQVDAHVAGKEVVALALATILGRELLGGDPSHLWLLVAWDLLHQLVAVLHGLSAFKS
jgi:hypothetical protein